MTILVSACLLGVACRYDGKSKPNDTVLSLMDRHTIIPICPEIFGGLSTPRPAAEIRDDRVITQNGCDVTEAYLRGAGEVLRLAHLYNATAAILKENSPSCGSGYIHNGRFDGGMVEGWGIAAAVLRENGITVYSEKLLPFL